MTGEKRDRKPPLLASAARVFDLSFGQMLWSRRSLFLAVLVGSPVLLAVVLRLVSDNIRINGTQPDGKTAFGLMMWLLYVRFIVPILGVFCGTALIADEVDDRTITYLFTRPISRSAVLLGKYLAYLACTILLALPSAMIVFFLIVPMGGGSIGAAFPSLLADFAMIAVGLAAYGAVFALVGTRLKRPLLVGLLFALGWEPTVLLLPGYLKRLTVAYYLQALVKHDMPQESAVGFLMQIFREVPSVATSVVALGFIVGATLWLAARAVERCEYVLEQ